MIDVASGAMGEDRETDHRSSDGEHGQDWAYGQGRDLDYAWTVSATPHWSVPAWATLVAWTVLPFLLAAYSVLVSYVSWWMT